MKANLRKFHWMSIDRMKIRNSIIALTLIFSLLSMSVSGYAIMQKDNSDVSSSVSGISDAVISAEDVSKRGEFEKHYLLSDGSFVAVSYPEAVHYLTDDGVWEEVDNRLLYDNDVSRIVNGESDFAVSFADSPAENYLAALSYAGRTFSWGLSITKSENGKTVQLNNFASDKARIVSAEKIIRSGEKVSSEASVLGKKISDAEVFENAKISGKLRYSKLFSDAPEISADYSVYHNKIEEDIFINAPTDIRSFTMNIQSGGLLVCLNDDGSVDFLDENGDMQYHIGIPYMEDANGDVLNDIDVSVKQNGNACTVTYTPDESWLTSSDREYPILLDPSVTTKEYNSNIVDTYVYEGNTANHSSEQKLFFGVKSGKIHRVYLKINNLPSIDAGSPILSAKMTLSFWAGTSTGKTAEVYKAAGAWNPSEITYAGQPGYISSSRLISLPFSASNKTMTFDLTDDIAKLYDDYYADENFGYVIKYSDETLNNPDYNTFYATDATLSDKRPVMTVVYGYSLPSHLVEGGIYSLENAGSGSLATVHNGTDANYVNIYQYNTEISARTASQKFKLEKVSATGGYLFRAMCSANGTNRVIDIQRNGDYPYPENGGNAYLYTATASKTQEWLIIGVTNSSFKIVLRNDMTLALTAYPSTANGTSGGKTSSSPGNIFLATYDATNVYQEWKFIDESGSYVPADYEYYYLNGTYYINNTETGKYLHKNSSSSIPNAVAGLISNLGDSIRWKITHIGNGEYLIQPVDDLTKYLKVVSKNGGGVIYGTLSSNGEIPAEYRWKFVQQRFKNVSSSSYLYVYAVNTTSYGVSETTNTSKAVKWRVVRANDYGNTSSYPKRELSEYYTMSDMILAVGQEMKPSVSSSFASALWANSNDFTYTVDYSSPVGCIFYNNQTQKITAVETGNATVKATHKVTGKSKSFSVRVKSTDPFHYENIEYIRISKYDQSYCGGDKDITVIITKSSLNSSCYFEEYATGRDNIAFVVDDELIDILNNMESQFASNPVLFTTSSYFHAGKIIADSLIDDGVIAAGSVEYYGIWVSETNRLLIAAKQAYSVVNLAVTTVTAAYSTYQFVSSIKTMSMAINSTQVIYQPDYTTTAGVADDLVSDMINNPNSNTVMLGTEAEGKSWYKIAQQRGDSYFYSPNYDNYVAKYGNDGMLAANKMFISKAKDAGKTFWFSHDPLDTLQHHSKSTFAYELRYLELTYNIDLSEDNIFEIGEYWCLIP